MVLEVTESARQFVNMPRAHRSSILATLWRFEHRFDQLCIKFDIDGVEIDISVPIEAAENLGKNILAMCALELVKKKEED